MPFAAAFDAVFETVREVATTAVPGTAVETRWLKDVHAAGRITDDILLGLQHAAFCIADVSGHNANVMWETGFAMALGKPTILIGQDIAALPFDLRSHRVLEYAQGHEHALRAKLGEAIRQTLARYELKGRSAGAPTAPSAPVSQTITVTGSMSAKQSVVLRRIEQTLSPYLSSRPSWLVGSAGVVDEVAAHFLIEREQRVTAVGYHRFDCAPGLRQLVDEGRIAFLDASVERIPRAMSGPSARDAYFCMKSDLVVLCWDGNSEGTKALADYFRGQGVATLLGFL